MTSFKKIFAGAAVTALLAGTFAVFSPASAADSSIANGAIGGPSGASISSSVSKPVYSFRDRGDYGFGHYDQNSYGGGYSYHADN